VQAWSEETVNLIVFRDGSNDRQQSSDGSELTVWRTSISLERDVSLPENASWHWPERED
jgi:hypothetical protein